VKSHDDWLLKWVPTLTKVLVKKATETPRISKIYSLLKVVLIICSKHSFFKNSMHEEEEQKVEQDNQ
jgi:hypothetical protein